MMFIHLVFSSIVGQTPFNITSLLAKEQIYEKEEGDYNRSCITPINVIWCCPHTMPLVTEVTTQAVHAFRVPVLSLRCLDIG